jgi:hypothetical protein
MPLTTLIFTIALCIVLLFILHSERLNDTPEDKSDNK